MPIASGTITDGDQQFEADSERTPLRRPLPRSILVLGVLLGICLRLWVSGFGFNRDVRSWSEVVMIVERGDSVYASTRNYNYGPVWFHILYGLSRLALLRPDPGAAFLLLLSAFLTAVDLGIFTLLRRRVGDRIALLFFLNPVSVVISGYHRQFGNLALLLGLLAAELFDHSGRERLDRRKWAGMAILGLSLATKHVLFAFPWWLAVKQRRVRHKLIVLFVPVLLFAAAFVPYWAEGRHGIIRNVLLYKSLDNEPLWNWVLPPLLAGAVPARLGLVIGLAVAGVALRRTDAFRSLLFYTAFLLILSPAIANQYLALVMPFAVCFLNPFTALYTLVAGAFLVVAPDGLGLAPDLVFPWMYSTGYGLLVALLAGGLFWIRYRDQTIAAVARLGRWLQREARVLVGRQDDDL